MADTITIPATGSGTATPVVATDDCAAAGHAQIVKLAISTDGSATLVPAEATNGLDVDVTRVQGTVTVGSHDVTNAGTFAVQASLVAGGDVDVLTVPADPFGVNADAQSASGSISAKLKFIATTGIPVTGTVTVGAHAVTNAGTFATQVDGAALTALQLLDDPVATLGTTTYTETTTKGMIVGAVRRDADTTLVDTTNEVGPLQMDANGRLKVEAFSGETLPVSLASTTVTGTVTVDSELPTAAAISAENTAAPTAPSVYTFPLVFDGTNWDRSPGTSADGTLVNLGANNDVTITSGTVTTVSTVTAVTTVTNPVTVAGGAAHASPVSGNPNLVAGRASTAVPTDVGADGDAASLWTNRNGAQVIGFAPHVALVGSPWTLTSKTAQYTTTQTSAVLQAGGASEKIVVTSMQIQAAATTAGTMQVYFGTGAYSRGTSLALFDGEFAPSATLKPGVVMQGPFVASTNGDDVLVTTSANLTVTVTIWYYLVT